jgi:hypothetical protein
MYAYCEDFSYKDETIKVIDSSGFYILEELLFDYLMQQCQEAI